MNMERELFQGDDQDYAHKRSLRTGAPLRPAAGKPHIRLHYNPKPPRGFVLHPWCATIHHSRGTVPHAVTPQCSESWRAVKMAVRLGMLL